MTSTEVVAADRWTSPDGCADHYGLTRQMVYKLLAQGLPSIKIGRARRINLVEADEWIRERQADWA